jgi:DedD protein
MERPLKQRLIGATILVVVAVVVLPGLLAGRREVVTLEPTRDDSGVPLRAHEFSMGETPTAEEQAVAADELQPDPLPGEVAAAPEPLPMTPPSGVPVAAAPAVAPAATLPPTTLPAAPPPVAAPPANNPVPAAATKPVTAPAKAAAPPAVVTPPVVTPVTAPVKAPVKAPAKLAVAPASPVVNLSGWVVQIGSFGTRQKADELVAKLQAKGFRAFTLPYTAAGRTLHRVRVGPEQNRQKADQIAKRLEADGYQPHVAPQE